MNCSLVDYTFKMLDCIMFKTDAQPTEDLESQPLEMDVSILAPNQSPTVSFQTLVLLFWLQEDGFKVFVALNFISGN